MSQRARTSKQRDGSIVGPIRVWPAYHGVLVGQDIASAEPFFGPEGDHQRGEDYDFVEPELALDRPLTPEDLAAFDADDARASTNFGTPRQDKSSNQDFACAAGWGEGGRRFRFACVADGVSTRTFWGARGSRIAALIAFTRARDCVRQLFGEDGKCDERAAEAFRTDLAEALRSAFARDREALNAYVDPEWAEKVYKSASKNEKFWYNTTLLIAIVGDAETIVLTAGDGAVIELGDKEHIVQNSPETMTITSFAWLHMDAAMLKLEIRPTVREFLLATDGPDRTVQDRSKGGPPAYAANLRVQAPKETLVALAEAADVDKDNLSLAVVAAPGTFAGSVRSGRAFKDKAKGGSARIVPTVLILLVIAGVAAVWSAQSCPEWWDQTFKQVVGSAGGEKARQ